MMIVGQRHDVFRLVLLLVAAAAAARCSSSSNVILYCHDYGYSASWGAVARATWKQHQQQRHLFRSSGSHCGLSSSPLASSSHRVVAFAGRAFTRQEACCDPRRRRRRRKRRVILSSSSQHINHQSYGDDEKEDPFPSACSALGLTVTQQDDLIKALVTTGLVQQYTNGRGSDSSDIVSSSSSSHNIIINSHLLLTISRDYFESSQTMSLFSKALQDDFALTPLHAHVCRAVTWHILKQQQQQQQHQLGQEEMNDNDSMITLRSAPTIHNKNINNNDSPDDTIVPMLSGLTASPTRVVTNGVIRPHHAENDGDETLNDNCDNSSNKKPKRPLYKQVILDSKTQQRKQRYSSLSSFNINNNSTSATTIIIPQEYGLHRDLNVVQQLHPILAQELRDYYQFMTCPNTLQQEQDPPLRTATADVYMRHARLFLGWYIRTQYNSSMSPSSSNSSSISSDLSGSSHYNHHGSMIVAASDINGIRSNSSSNNNINNNSNTDTISISQDLSLDIIFPTPQKESVTALLDFMVWLRRERNIAVSYEANLWRGLIKLLKFRFRHHETSAGDGGSSSSSSKDGSGGETVPAIRQARSWHRRAHHQSSKAPKQSNEDAKWLSWPQYLGVVQQMAVELQEMLTDYYNGNKKQSSNSSSTSSNGADADVDGGGDKNEPVYTVQERKIATFYQKYLILAIFATVPDRQRTIRELEIGKSLVRITAATAVATTTKINEVWCIKHAPDEYKTGGTYGERPPMYLTEVSNDIDVFLSDWRPCLCVPHQQQSSHQVQQQHKFLFVQPRTGNPLTSDSVYQIVARQCYTYTGQRTNPHLLRDMIVTHVRESQQGVTEPQLEALALFMGHSVAVQRASYDRRTLTKKVAPAVNLIQQVNTQAQNNNININKNISSKRK